MEGHQSLKTHCSAAAGFLPKSGGGVGRRRSSFSSSSCWTPPRFLRHPKRTGGSWISVVEIRTPPLRSLPALSLQQQQQQQQQEFVNIVEGNDDDDDDDDDASSSSEKSKKKKNIDDDDEMVGSSGGRRRSSSSVHVKFVLHKECSFGEKFLLVGDDPMFGLWDLQNAIPLNWSEGHFWTAEMDLPLEKSTIQFKFILGDDASSSSGGEFHWQPGPDRVLHIWDTPNTIVVTEDWDKAENQKLTEEEEEDQPPPLLMQQQLMMITNQDGGDNVQQLLAACGLTSINPPPPPPPVSAEAEAEAEPPIADFPNDDDDENESKPLDNIMFTSEKANELECYSSQSTQQLNV